MAKGTGLFSSWLTRQDTNNGTRSGYDLLGKQFNFGCRDQSLSVIMGSWSFIKIPPLIFVKVGSVRDKGRYYP